MSRGVMSVVVVSVGGIGFECVGFIVGLFW